MLMEVTRVAAESSDMFSSHFASDALPLSLSSSGACLPEIFAVGESLETQRIKDDDQSVVPSPIETSNVECAGVVIRNEIPKTENDENENGQNEQSEIDNPLSEEVQNKSSSSVRPSRLLRANRQRFYGFSEDFVTEFEGRPSTAFSSRTPSKPPESKRKREKRDWSSSEKEEESDSSGDHPRIRRPLKRRNGVNDRTMKSSSLHRVEQQATKVHQSSINFSPKNEMKRTFFSFKVSRLLDTPHTKIHQFLNLPDTDSQTSTRCSSRRMSLSMIPDISLSGENSSSTPLDSSVDYSSNGATEVTHHDSCLSIHALKKALTDPEFMRIIDSSIKQSYDPYRHKIRLNPLWQVEENSEPNSALNGRTTRRGKQFESYWNAPVGHLLPLAKKLGLYKLAEEGLSLEDRLAEVISTIRRDLTEEDERYEENQMLSFDLSGEGAKEDNSNTKHTKSETDETESGARLSRETLETEISSSGISDIEPKRSPGINEDVNSDSMTDEKREHDETGVKHGEKSYHNDEKVKLKIEEICRALQPEDMAKLFIAMERHDPYDFIYVKRKKEPSDEKFSILAHALALRRGGYQVEFNIQQKETPTTSEEARLLTLCIDGDKLKLLRSRGNIKTRISQQKHLLSEEAVRSFGTGYYALNSPNSSSLCSPGTFYSDDSEKLHGWFTKDFLSDDSNDDLEIMNTTLRETTRRWKNSHKLENSKVPKQHRVSSYNRRAGRPKVNRAGCKCLLCATCQTPQWRFMTLYNDQWMDLVCNACYMKFNGTRPHYTRPGKNPPALPELQNIEKPYRPSLDEYKVKGPCAFPNLMRRNDSKQFAILGKTSTDVTSDHLVENRDDPLMKCERSPHRVSVTRNACDRSEEKRKRISSLESTEGIKSELFNTTDEEWLIHSMLKSTSLYPKNGNIISRLTYHQSLSFIIIYYSQVMGILRQFPLAPLLLFTQRSIIIRHSTRIAILGYPRGVL